MIKKCPCCHSDLLQSHKNFLIQYSGLGDSCFNNTFKMITCTNCGLVFNSKLFDIDLKSFYESEAFYSGLEHFDPLHPANITRNNLFCNMLNITEKNTTILDVGCGRGGFVHFLRKKGISAFGVDFEADQLNSPSENAPPFFHEGRATSLPFSDNYFDIITYFHVLEHIPDLDTSMREANRVLKDTGHLLIEVPNAEQYGVIENADLHWYSSREHVYHFTRKSIHTLLDRYGFSVKETYNLILPMSSFLCTSLVCVAGKKDIPTSANFFINMQTKLKDESEKLLATIANYNYVVIWGMGSAIFALLPFIYDKIKNKLIIVDSNIDKQKLKYKETPVQSPESVQPGANKIHCCPAKG